MLGLFALPELCDLLIARTSIAPTARYSIKTGMLQGAKDCFTNWWLVLRCSWIGAGFGMIPGMGGAVIDWLAYGHALAHRKGRQGDLRQGRRPRRRRVRKLQQRQGRRRA